MKQPEQRFSFYSSGAPGKNLCIIYCIQGPISLQHRGQFMLYVTRGGFTNFGTMPYLGGEEGPKL